HAVIKHTANALFDARNIFPWNRASDDFGFELEPLALLLRFQNELDASKLARTTRLLLVRVVHFLPPGDRLTISDLWRADVSLDLELALHAVDDDFQMKLPHPLDNGLAAFGIGRNAEGGVFLSEPVEGHAHLFLVGLRLRLNRDLDNRIRELHAFQNYLIARIAEGVAGDDIL